MANGAGTADRKHWVGSSFCWRERSWSLAESRDSGSSESVRETALSGHSSGLPSAKTTPDLPGRSRTFIGLISATLVVTR
jgi:hypothetical protein